jgi:DNA-binding response OmpR family regulator
MSGKPFRVAIVDDDTAIRRLVNLYLKRAGYDVVHFATGNEAREQLVRIAWDLAILDRRLPDMDGLDLCQQLKSDPDLRNRYIIILTGEDEAEDKILGLDLGADDYITKPNRSSPASCWRASAPRSASSTCRTSCSSRTAGSNCCRSPTA